MRRIPFAGALAAALFALTGCGDSGPKVVPVSGTVTIDGKPLAYGFVQVMPADWRPATGKIGPDGRFTLTTMKEGDGCVAGTHPVAILASESLSPETTKWHAPKKYADAVESKLTVTVSGPTDDLKIELKWNGGKPFVEKYQKEGGTEHMGGK
jgi:hypothetical protein